MQVNGEIKNVSDSKVWYMTVNVDATEVKDVLVTQPHRDIKHEGYTLGGGCLCACVCLYSSDSLTTFLSWTRTYFFVLPRFPNETLLLIQTMTKLYSLEDEWLSYWPLLSPDSIHSKLRIATSFWPTEADTDKLTIRNGNIKHDLLHRIWE